MSRRKIFVIILGIIAVALILSLLIVPGLADTLRNGIVEYGGPIGTWAVETYNGFATSSFAQTYLVPPWNAFGFGCLFIGIIALILWKKGSAIHWPGRKTSQKVEAMEFQREPAEPESAPKPRTSPEPSPTPEEST